MNWYRVAGAQTYVGRLTSLWSFCVPSFAASIQALDFIVYCAKLFDVKLILALGNFWDAYKGPEDFLWYAMGAAGNMNKGCLLLFFGFKNTFICHLAATHIHQCNMVTDS